MKKLLLVVVLVVAIGIGPLIAQLLIRVPRYFGYQTSPEELGFTANDYQNITLYSHDPVYNQNIELCGWYFPSIRESRIDPNNSMYNKSNANATIITIHGHGSSMGRIIGADMSLLHKAILPLWNAGYNILAIDLRNHGYSGYSGLVTLGYYEALDVLSAIDFVVNKSLIEQNEANPRIGLWGESMGGATVLQAASRDSHQNHIKAVLSDASFSSLEDVVSHWASHKAPWLPQILIDYFFVWIHFFMPIPMENLSVDKLAGSINAPVMIVHGTTDKIVPYYNAEKIIDSFKTEVA